MPKNYIVLHHSANADHGTLKDFDAIKRWHTEHNGWRDIGYHWVIERVNGILTAIPGRPEWDTGAHCPGRNQDGIGICVVGNFQETVPDPEIYPVVANLCKQIMARHPIKSITGHYDHCPTLCPGKNFNLDRVRQLVYQKPEVKGEENLQEVKVKIGDKEVMGLLINATAYVPIRDYNEAIVETMKSAVDEIVWHGGTKSVEVK